MPSSEPRPELARRSRTGVMSRGFAIVASLAIWLAVAAGGAIGSLLRHGVNVLFSQWLSRPIPHATAAVNLVGAGIIGILAGTIASGHLQLSVAMRAFLF